MLVQLDEENILNDINTMLCPVKNNSNKIELTVHTSCYWVLDLLCVKCVTSCVQFENIEGLSFGTDILKGGWRTCEKG